MRPETLQKMIRGSRFYGGLGFSVVKAMGRTLYATAGEVDGFNSSVVYLPDDQTTSIVLSSLDGPAVTISSIGS